MGQAQFGSRLAAVGFRVRCSLAFCHPATWQQQHQQQQQETDEKEQQLATKNQAKAKYESKRKFRACFLTFVSASFPFLVLRVNSGLVTGP